MPGPHGMRRALAALLGLAMVACGTAAPTGSHHATPTASAGSTLPSDPLARAQSLAGAVPVAGQPPVNGMPWYLTIGDSITFGFSLDPARMGVNSSWALQLQGLLAASGRPWKLYDTACVSETTDTYYTRCRGSFATPFLANQSQHDAAMTAIRTHRADLHAVFVDLGSNDLLRALRSDVSVDTAIAGLRPALVRIVDELHAAAPGVPVILCNYYDPVANLAPVTRQEALQVNAMVAQVARSAAARLADVFSAFNGAGGGATPDPQLCRWVDCAHGDIHPTVAGQARLAQVALAALDAPPS